MTGTHDTRFCHELEYKFNAEQSSHRKHASAYLVILYPKPKDFSQLENIGLQNQQNYSKSLQKLPGLVKNCDVLSQMIQIRK